jgi:dipeptide/tripeptide permease
MTGEPTWFGHPRGLTILFLTNMWEQFSYYGMRALLVYYMTKQLLLAQGTSSLVYGYYTAFAYLTPLLGGFIADRYLGKKLAIIIGGSVMALGHFMMTQEPLFFVALVLLAVGVPSTTAHAYALVVHVVIWLPVTLAGFASLVHQGLGWGAITRVRELENAVG